MIRSSSSRVCLRRRWTAESDASTSPVCSEKRKMSELGSASRRHNPVDSIRRKIRTIEMRDQESNPYLQIPKFQSRNFDSPQSSTKKDLEEVLKNRAMKNSSSSSPALGLSPRVHVPSPLRQDSPLSGVLSKEKKVWSSRSCSTPLILPRDTHFKFQPSTIPPPATEFRSLTLEERVPPSVSNFYLDHRLDNFSLKSPVVKRLSLSESAGLRRVMEQRPEPAVSEVSLICEEDLLDSIFHACDTDHRGKVAVSKIVDYLRHTTSRGSEDSGLTELCNMLDPERRDISMDLDTYQAIMREWVDDCRSNAPEKESAVAAEDSIIKLHNSLLAVCRMSGTPLNITSGSLEALGGDISKDLDTSDLITCIADLQYNNQKLQEQQSKLKTAVDAQEETNQRLLEENEELRNQWKSAQQSISKARALKVELEEMKSSMNLQEEAKAKLGAQNKQMEKENLALIHKISSLQEENHRSALEVEAVRKTLSEVTEKAADLQVQLNEFESELQKKEAGLLVRDLYVEELKSTLMEYGSIIESLRTEKSTLEHNLQQMEHELLSNGINSPITYKLNRVINGGLSSLHTELEFAQQSPEVSTAEWMLSSGRTSALDVTLDREVLLLFQGPAHEQLAAEFKAVLQTLQDEACVLADQILVSLQSLIASDISRKDLAGRMLELITGDLKEKRVSWAQKLKQLEKHRESLDREFIRMSGNVRRMKTEQLHLNKELSARSHDVEAARRQLEEAEEREREITAKHQHLTQQVAELRSSLIAVRSHNQPLRGRLEEADQERAAETLSRCHIGEEEGHRETIGSRSGRLSRHQKSCISEETGHQKSRRLSGPPNTAADRLTEGSPLLDALSLEVGESCRQKRVLSRPVTADPGKPDTRHLEAARSGGGDLSPGLLIAVRCTLVSFGVQTDVEAPEMEKTLSKDVEDRLPTAVDESSSPVNSHSCADGATQGDAVAAIAVQCNAAQDSGTSKDRELLSSEKESEQRKVTPTEVAVGSSSPLGTMSSPCAEEKRSSANEKEMETEFLRLSLGFKCDLFTLDKRLRLEERSRDLAEENLKKELAGCQKLLEALTPLCEDDNQTHDIVKKLQQSLQFLSRHTVRVASRAEMLGAIHQESRVSKAVEVMIQHVENLKRMYAKEHAELEELREVMQQSGRSSCMPDRDDPLKLISSLASKVSPARRVSMPAYPRGMGIGSPMDLFGGDKIDIKHKRSNSWKLVGSRQTECRPSLQRFVDAYARPETPEENLIKEDESSAESAEEIKEPPIRKLSILQKCLPPAQPDSRFYRVFSWPTEVKRSFSNINRPIVIFLGAAFLFVLLTGFLTGLSLHRPAEGAPVGPGISWTSMQQLLWPYTGLQHNGPPPV